jgi:pyruvate formate lyase activating enzyme
MQKAVLWEKIDDKNVRCFLCSHYCRIAPDGSGFCGVRQNRGGELVTHAYGRLIAAHVDPIEKKPLYHFLPGTSSYSVATTGCNFRCGFCQN